MSPRQPGILTRARTTPRSTVPDAVLCPSAARCLSRYRPPPVQLADHFIKTDDPAVLFFNVAKIGFVGVKIAVCHTLPGNDDPKVVGERVSHRRADAPTRHDASDDESVDV